MSWPIVTLGSLEGGKGNFVDGPFGSNLKSSEYTSSGVPLIQLKNIKTNKYITKDLKYVSQDKADSISRHSYKAGDVCIAKLGAVGTACIIPEGSPDGIIVADVVRFRGDKSLIDYKYFCHYLNSQIGQRRILKFSRGSTRTRTNLTDLKKVEIPLPPLDEQKRIAAILDKADAIRRKRQQAIKLADDFLRSVFLDMFGNPSNYSGNFEMMALGDICKKITDGEHGTVKRLEKGKLYLMARNITKEGKLDISDVSYISEDDHSRIYKRCGAEENDILLVCVGATIGKATLVPKMEQFSLARSVALIKPDLELLEPTFLLHLIKSTWMQRRFINSGNSSAQAGLYLGKIKEMKIPVPSVDLQQKFRNIEIEVQNALFNYKDFSSESSNCFNSLSQKAFSGEL